MHFISIKDNNMPYQIALMISTSCSTV